MAEHRRGNELDPIESVIETRGVEEAVRVVFASSGDERRSLLAALEQACGVRFGDDEGSWLSWLEELRARGVLDFGSLPKGSALDVPPDPKIIAAMISESTGLGACEEEADPGLDRVISNYEFIEKLGEGSMGVVYKARQLSMDRIVAVKLLAGWLSRDEKYVSRFLREARLVAKLDHPNIVRGIDAGSDGATYYFAMEYVEGEPLGRTLRRRGSFPERSALRIAMEIASALAHAWKHGLVHRDIKPDNIILTKGGEAKLADLGLAKSIAPDASQMTQTGTSVGTPHYMSPEQVRGEKEIDVRSDIYSLGATLYHLVAGHTPFAAPTPITVAHKHLTETPVPAHVRNPEVSVNTSSVIDKMMAKDPADRYANPSQLMEDIALVAKGQTPRHAAPVRGMDALPAATRSLIGVEEFERAAGPRRLRRGRRLLLATAAGTAFIALALYLGFRGTAETGDAPASQLVEEARTSVSPEREAEMISAREAAAMAEDLYKKARIDEALGSLDKFLTAARFDESRRLVRSEREKLLGIMEELRRLTAADLVKPRQDAREAKTEAGKAPREPAVEGSFARMRELWERAERAFEAENLPKAFLSYQGCREAAEEISARPEEMEACVKAAKEAAAARGASEALSRYAATEWRVAESAFRAAEKKRLEGEFSESARSYVAARGAYEQHRKEAVKLARDTALSRVREAEARGDQRAALAACREAARYGVKVAGKIAGLEDALARRAAMDRARSHVDRKKWKEAAAALFDLLRRWPSDVAASSLLAEVTEQVRKEPPLALDLGGGVTIELVYVLPGKFRMGAADGEPDELPVHEVTISKGFYVGRFEVTQAQYEQVTGRNPSYWKGPARPVERVSWEDAVSFCRKLSERTGSSFRLPTEAEWEYAARAGSAAGYCFGDDVKLLNECAWYAANSGRETHPVGAKEPNAWRLDDMHGNVWEWCADAYSAGYYSESPAEDPKGPEATREDSYRALRGGSWLSKARHCRSAERIRYREPARYPDVGFRVVCEAAAE